MRASFHLAGKENTALLFSFYRDGEESCGARTAVFRRIYIHFALGNTKLPIFFVMKKGNPLFRPPHYSGEALWADNAAMILPPAAFRLSPPALRAGTRFIIYLSDNTIQRNAYALSSSSAVTVV